VGVPRRRRTAPHAGSGDRGAHGPAGHGQLDQRHP
jgi:hypothetical protein